MKIVLQIISTVLLFLISLSVSAEVKLPKLIGDGMVLQRDIPLKIWGWAAPNETLVVKFNRSDYRTSAGSDGSWEITLPPQPAGGPYSMTIEASNTISINNILIGDVWVCSGQSNMELQMSRVAPAYKPEIALAGNPEIRHFEVPQVYNFKEPQKDLQYGKWVEATPQTVLNFSAAAYFFAKELYDRYQVPIGLINSSLGGSPAESWISEDSLKRYPGYYKEAQLFKDDNLIRRILSNDKNRIETWYNAVYQKDKGNKPPEPWYAEKLNTSDWLTMDIPGYWPMENDRPVNGVMWFRRNFDIPAGMIEHAASPPATLVLGSIVDADSVYINGTFVGTTSYQYPPRRYAVPAGLLKAQNNSISIRIINSSGRGGFVFDKFYGLEFENGQKADLSGAWHYKLGARTESLAGETFIRWKPLGLYNAMIAPLLNYPIKGVIWYQGESNTSKALEYRELFPTLIRDWRSKWNQGDFPFLFVQLANFMKTQEQPSESDWALLRESQLKSLSVPNTGMAVAIDIGEWNDIHPLNKQDVGKRLALAARKLAYGEENVVYSGPVYESMETKDGKIILSFSHTGSGLMAKGGKLNAFAIAGEDNQFVWADAVIENDRVVVRSEKVKNPVAVRYAWADNPGNANLYNKEGLPASPFRVP
ncbi:MAG: sialate O-acetylesterase [Dysgonamonadaceae bacterium]|jgi:sialate O-acetylesterase|nr:sialate O-acetylesterase [Dysgonamonadaceae bacterium]